MDNLVQPVRNSTADTVLLNRSVLQGLLNMTGERDGAVQLDRVYFVPRQALIVSANADTMIWVRHRFLQQTEPFCISRDACEWALQIETPVPKEIGIQLPANHLDGRRRVTLYDAKRQFSELENLAPYPNFNRVLAQRPSQREADYDPEQLLRVQKAMALVTGQRELPVHIIRRGSALAFVVCTRSTVLGFIAPWEDARFAERVTASTLREFGVDCWLPVRPLGAPTPSDADTAEAAPGQDAPPPQGRCRA